MMTNPNPAYDPVSVRDFLERECKNLGMWIEYPVPVFYWWQRPYTVTQMRKPYKPSPLSVDNPSTQD